MPKNSERPINILATEGHNALSNTAKGLRHDESISLNIRHHIENNLRSKLLKLISKIEKLLSISENVTNVGRQFSICLTAVEDSGVVSCIK